MYGAWYGEQRLKDAALARLAEHRRLDQLTQGTYFKDGRGCHLGCLTHANEGSHSATERLFAIPERIAYWLEAVFEGLSSDQCAAWVIESTAAIPVGADLSLCHHHLAHWLLGTDSPSAAGNEHELVREAVVRVRDLHRRAAAGELIDDEQWPAARSAAESAARPAARSAAESAARYAAESAARSAATSAAWSAWSAAESAAWSAWSARSAARSAAWSEIAARSIEIFAAAPILRESEPCDECVAETLSHLATGDLVGVIK